MLHSTKTRVLISSTQRKAGHSSSGLPPSPHWEAETGKRLELSAQPTRLIEMLYLKKKLKDEKILQETSLMEGRQRKKKRKEKRRRGGGERKRMRKEERKEPGPKPKE